VSILQNVQNNYVRYSIILFALILTVSLIFCTSPKHTHGDFDVYYAASQNYLAKAPVYIPHNGIEEFKYSPLFALVFSPLTLLKSTTALYIWNILNIFSLYFMFYLFYKLKQMSFSKPRDLLIIVCLFALTGRFIFSNIKLGQINILLCCLMVITMYLEINKKYFWASVTLAFSLMIKLFPLLFLFYFVLTRRFKLLGLTILMIIFFLLLPSIYSGFELNLRYLNDWLILLKSTPSHLLYSVRNNSLLSFYSWFFIARHDIYYVFDYNLITKRLTPEVYYFWVGSCFVFFSAFFYDTLYVKYKEIKTVFLDYSCLLICGLLFNPLAYLNALVFLIVPYFFILRYLFYAEIKSKHAFIIAFLIFSSFILNMVDQRIFFKNVHQFYVLLQCKPLMWTIILVYLSLFTAKLSLKHQQLKPK
jgi:Glycosyltransferase family 87